jgi:tetratricopeptide (TPR) repeat protein
MGCGASKPEVSPQQEDDFDEASASVIAIIANIPVLGFVFKAGGVIPVVGAFSSLLESTRRLFYEARAIANSAKDVVAWAEATRDAFEVLKDALASKADAPLEKAVLIHVKIAEECIHKLFSRSTYIAAGCSTLAAYIKSASFPYSFQHARERVAEAESRLILMLSVLGNAKHDTTHAMLQQVFEKLGISDVPPAIMLNFQACVKLVVGRDPRALLTQIDGMPSIERTAAIFYVQGAAHEALNELEDAIDSYKEATLKSPECPEAWLALGLALYEKSTPVHTEEELEAYEKCIALLPDDGELLLYEATISASAHSNLGAGLASLKDYERAERALRRGIRLKETDASLHYHLGMVYHDLLWRTQLPEVYLRAARYEYERAIELNHEEWSPLAQAALAHFKQPYIMHWMTRLGLL